MFDLIYFGGIILVFPVAFIFLSVSITADDKKSITKMPTWLKMALSIIGGAGLSVCWLVVIPAVFIILIGMSFAKPYELMCNVLYKLVYNKE